MPDAKKMLLWVDLETTGDRPTYDKILEVAWIITDMDLNVYAPVTSMVVRQSIPNTMGDWSRNSWKDLMIPIVAEMHEKNGLRAAIDRGEGHPLVYVESAIIASLGMFEDETFTKGLVDGTIEVSTEGGPEIPIEWILAGSGVSQLDSRFIQAQMPSLQKFLAYYFIDIGQTRRLLRDIVGFKFRPEIAEQISQAGKVHRAGDDIEHHLLEARLTRDEIRHQSRFVFGDANGS
jgi:oligoribonuclease (3'-5' exoribonuclease)